MSSSKNLEFEKTAFLSKSNSTFIEEMYMKYVNNDPNLPDSWKEYFNEIGDETDVIIKEINGPSWSPTPKQALIKDNQKNFQNDRYSSELEIMKSNAASIKAVALIRSISSPDIGSMNFPPFPSGPANGPSYPHL